MPDSYKEDGRPADQWYWDDWFSSHDVQSCSWEAQGLWINLLGIMFASEIRGTLMINGQPMNNKAIAKRFGKSNKTVDKLIAELEREKVFSRLEDGTIINRRMFNRSNRKDYISKIRSEAGKKGAEDRWQTNGKDDSKNMAEMATSSPTSSPTPSSSSKKDTFAIKEFNKFWGYWPSERRSRKQKCLSKFKALIKADKLEKFWRTTRGYSQYIEYQKKIKSFNQEVMLSYTWLNTWEDEYEKYKDFRYEPRL